MKRQLSGLLAAFVLLASPVVAQAARGAKQDSVKPAPKTAAKADTAKPNTKVPPKADATKQAGAKTDTKVPAKVETKIPAKADTKVPAKADSKAPATKTDQKAGQSKQAAPPPAAGAAKPDTGNAASVSQSGGKNQMTIMREVYAYEPAGRRDPMMSLANTSTLRPLLTEIECIGILYDEDGRNSEAIMRSLDKKKTYRIKVGQMLGRMTVAQITRREVVFTVDEYGFSRQVSMPVKPDTSIARTP